MIKSLMLLGVLSIVALVSADDKMTKLNGCPPFKSDFYSGYLNGTGTETKDGVLATGHNYHYLMVKSENDPVNDPVVFWFNGGPGCSSMLAFSQENGPYFVSNVDNTCVASANSWSKNFTMVYLEHPVGVGFSTAPANLTWNDIAASKDQFAGIALFFEKYPDLIKNDLYLSGESYGGIYVPYGSWQIYQNNLQFNVTNGCDADHPYPDKCTHGTASNFTGKFYNLRGMMVGNGATNWNVDAGKEAFIDTLWGFNMIPTDLHKSWKDQGCQQYFGTPKTPVIPNNMPGSCQQVADKVAVMAKGLDLYDLYRESNDVALKGEDRMGEAIVGGEVKRYKKGATVREYTPWMASILGDDHPSLDVKLFGDFVSDWLNNATTRADLNIPEGVQAWEMCTDRAGVDAETYKLLAEGSFWIYPILANNGIRILHYSGDTDGAVPTIGTKRWIKLLESPIVQGGEWRPWFENFQVGGMVINHEVLTFATVRGVGHMAPQWAGPQVNKMINDWVNNTGDMAPVKPKPPTPPPSEFIN